MNQKILSILTIIVSMLFVLSCSSRTSISTASNTNTNSEVERAAANARNAMETAANKAALAANQAPVVLPGKRALVITENANLRKSADSKGEVIQTIPNGTNVEWVEQRGAWFAIRKDGKLGWMHGNTIRLLPQTTMSTLPSSTSPSSSSDDIMRKIREECSRQAAAGDQSPLCGDVERNGIR